MGFFMGIWLALLGVLGASSLIVAKRPDAKESLARLAPYQGWIGAISALGGAWGIISSIFSIGLLSGAPIYWISYLAGSVLELALGLLLGVGIFKQFVKDAKANEQMDKTIAKLAPYQGTLGLVAIGLGVWLILVSILKI